MSNKKLGFHLLFIFPFPLICRECVRSKGSERHRGLRRLIALAEGKRRRSPGLWMCQRKLDTPGTGCGIVGRAEE